LRNNRNGWLHDEISGWVSTDGEEMPGILETGYLKFDDLDSDGTEWIDEKGIKKKLHKGGFVDIQRIVNDRYRTLLPEYYLRPYNPKYITIDELDNEIENLKSMIQALENEN
jgi:hypothetical protein